MAKQSMEDYLKTVYDLSKNGEPVNNNDIAKTLNVAPASVTEMLKKLVRKTVHPILTLPWHHINRSRQKNRPKNSTQTPPTRTIPI